VCNGTTPVNLKSLHGRFEFELQRFIDPEGESLRGVTYFDMTDQFQERYVSDRLQEVAGYYSNRLSYQEVERLIERLTGERQLSDQTIRDIAVDKATVLSLAIETEVKEILGNETVSFPKIKEKVDIYDSNTSEILVFADGVQVKGQKEDRQPNQLLKNDTPVPEETNKTPAVVSHVMLLEKKEGDFEYMTSVIDEQGEELIALPEVMKSNVIKEYGQEEKPLSVVAITDGAKDIRLQLIAVFGASLMIILDWYHLGKKVREFMSMIARNKEDKKRHLKFIFYHLWRGHVYTVLDYLKTEVEAKNEAKLHEFITYLDKHKEEIIDYKRRQKAGKVIGSGRAEKSCDQVIAYRQKKKAMSWSKLGSRGLGILKVAELNGQWKDLWFPKEAANDNLNLQLASNM